MEKFQLEIVDDSLQLHGVIGGSAPVQGEGTLKDKYFYFRARHDEWSFAVGDTQDEAIDICFPDQGFLRESKYGKPGRFDASYMPLSEAEQIVRSCAQEYLSSVDE